MKALTLILATLLISLTVSNFTPVPDFNISLLVGSWFAQSQYDTMGIDWSSIYGLKTSFDIINESALNMSSIFYDTCTNQFTRSSYIIYPDNENPAILFQDADHQFSPILVVNSSSIPYWSGTSPTIILVWNYTITMEAPLYSISGLSRMFDTQYDIRPFIKEQNLPPVNYTQNFYFVNTAIDAHFDWKPLRNFNASALLGEWNLIAVYEPFGHDLVPWYTQGPLFNWEEAICAKVNFEKDLLGYGQKMTLSLDSLLYNTYFEKTWELGITPDLNAALMGFDILGYSTLLYVGYTDLAGNMILTAGTTTSFFLSTKSNTLTTPLKAIFEAYLVIDGYQWDADYIIPIAPC